MTHASGALTVVMVPCHSARVQWGAPPARVMSLADDQVRPLKGYYHTKRHRALRETKHH